MIKSKRIAVAAMAAVLALAGAACGSDDPVADEPAAEEEAAEEPAAEEEAAEEPAEEAGPFLGLAFDTGGRGDGTFNDMAGQGADNAEANPDVYFGWIDGYYDGANIITTAFSEQEGSFLVGAAAALKSQTGKIGFIGGQEIDLIKRFEAGYIAGAQAVNPDIVVESAYLGAAGDNAAWGSPDKAKEIAGAWYADGADVVYTAAGGSGRGMIEAAVEAGEGKWAIGVDNDECSFDTEEQKAHRLTSMLKRVDTAVEQMAKSVQDGTAEGGFYTFNLANDGVGYATTCGNVDDIVDQLEEFKAQIIAGDIEVPTSPEGL